MKYFTLKTLLFTALLLFFSCSSDDEPTEALQPQLSVTDLVVETTENPEDGGVLGQFAVTQANLTAPLMFELTEVDPNGAVSVNSEGQLLVADVAAFDFETRQVITGEIEVSSGALSQTASFTINILDVDEGVPFITGWNLTNEELTIALPLYLGDSEDITEYNFSVDWGDGSEIGMVNSFEDPDAIHTYSSAGLKTVTIIGTLNGFNFNENATSKDLVVDVIQWGDMRLGNAGFYFAECINLTGFTATDAPILSEVTDMQRMFVGASSFNADLSTWDVSNVFNMEAMFFGAFAFNADLSSWDVSNVSNMNIMFQSGNFNGDISTWDVSKVEGMNGMFRFNPSFNGDLSSWDVSNVVRMVGMFNGASSFNGDISNWDVSSVLTMDDMFSSAVAFNADLSNWNVSNVLQMRSMFWSANSFNADLSGWDVSNVLFLENMFFGASSFSADLSSWPTDNVTRCSNFGVGSALTPEQLPTRGPCFRQ